MAKAIAPLDSELMKEFTDFIAPINNLAESSPGFIWRLKDEDGQSSSYVQTGFEDPLMIINLSVWNSLEDLRNFSYKTVHSYFIKHRTKWFIRSADHHLVCWWVKAGEFPNVEEAMNKLDRLKTHGPSVDAFTIKDSYLPNK